MSFKEQILDLRAQGLTYNQIVKRVGCSKPIVSYHCSHLKDNDQIRQQNIKAKRRALQIPKGKEETLRWLLLDGVRRTDIADIFEMPLADVQLFAERNGIKKKTISSNYERVKRRRRHLKMLAVTHKGGSCQECDYSKCLSAMDFHHKDPTGKDFTIANVASRSWSSVKAEVQKCVLLCCRCHRELHAELSIT